MYLKVIEKFSNMYVTLPSGLLNLYSAIILFKTSFASHSHLSFLKDSFFPYIRYDIIFIMMIMMTTMINLLLTSYLSITDNTFRGNTWQYSKTSLTIMFRNNSQQYGELCGVGDGAKDL